MEKIYGTYFLLASKTHQLPIPISKAIGISLLGSAYSEFFNINVIGTVFIQEEMTLNPFQTCFSRIALGETMRRLMFETVAQVSRSL